MTYSLADKLKKTIWKVVELMNFIQREVDSRERTANMTKSIKENTSKEHEKEKYRACEMHTKGQRMMTASALYSSSQVDRQVGLFCEKKYHLSKQCNDMSVPEKCEKLRNKTLPKTAVQEAQNVTVLTTKP